jgi:hypothetical protein
VGLSPVDDFWRSHVQKLLPHLLQVVRKGLHIAHVSLLHDLPRGVIDEAIESPSFFLCIQSLETLHCGVNLRREHLGLRFSPLQQRCSLRLVHPRGQSSSASRAVSVLKSYPQHLLQPNIC